MSKKAISVHLEFSVFDMQQGGVRGSAAVAKSEFGVMECGGSVSHPRP